MANDKLVLDDDMIYRMNKLSDASGFSAKDIMVWLLSYISEIDIDSFLDAVDDFTETFDLEMEE